MKLEDSLKSLRLAILLIACLSVPGVAQTTLQELYARGTQYLEQGKLSLAQQEFLRILRLNPNQAAACHYLGLIQVRQNNFPEAVRFFERACKLNSQDPQILSDLVAAYLAAGHADRALQRVDKLSRL